MRNLDLHIGQELVCSNAHTCAVNWSNATLRTTHYAMQGESKRLTYHMYKERAPCKEWAQLLQRGCVAQDRRLRRLSMVREKLTQPLLSDALHHLPRGVLCEELQEVSFKVSHIRPYIWELFVYILCLQNRNSAPLEQCLS